MSGTKWEVHLPANEESRARLKELHNCSSVFPLDKVLGIHKLPFKMSPKMMLLCVFCGQNQPSYKAAAEILSKLCNIQVSPETIRKVVNEVGGKLFEEDCAKSKETYENCSVEFKPPDEDAILYVEVDGAALNTRTKDDNGSTWRENKLGVCFKSDDIKQYVNPRTGDLEHRIEARQYVSYLGKAVEFRKHLFDMLVENGYGQGRQVVLLSDGAAWIANMAQEDYPGCLHNLDITWMKMFTRMPGKCFRMMKASTAHGQKISARCSAMDVSMKYLRYWQHCLQFKIEIASICHITWPHIETISTTPSISQRDISLEAAPLRAAIK